MSQYFIVSGGVAEPERAGTGLGRYSRPQNWFGGKTHFLWRLSPSATQASIPDVKVKEEFKKGSKGVTVFLLIIEVKR